jgi:hypothetical protein
VLCIHAPASTTITAPIHILHIQTPGSADAASASAPRVLIVAGSSSSLEVVEEYVSAGQPAAGATSSFCCPIAEVVLCEGAALKHAYVEREGAGAVCMKGTLVAQAARSQYHLVEARVGGSLTRHDVGIVQVSSGAGWRAGEQWGRVEGRLRAECRPAARSWPWWCRASLAVHGGACGRWAAVAPVMYRRCVAGSQSMQCKPCLVIPHHVHGL